MSDCRAPRPCVSETGATTSRRRLLAAAARLLCAGALGRFLPRPFAAYAGIASPTSSSPHLTIDVSRLATNGQSLVTTTGPDGAPIRIIRKATHRFLALSMQCTHEGCPVNPPVGGTITCPCHGSQYDLDGHVRRGPAQFPLARYATMYHPKTKTLTIRTPPPASPSPPPSPPPSRDA